MTDSLVQKIGTHATRATVISEQRFGDTAAKEMDQARKIGLNTGKHLTLFLADPFMY